MCTLTIIKIPKNNICIGFNRDELKNRKQAIPPDVYIHNDIKTLYPIDGNFKGTWFGINEYGFLFFLLNYNQKELYKNYKDNPYYKNKKSRGWIIPELIKFKEEKDIFNSIKEIPVELYAPFRLIFFSLQSLKVYVSIFTGKAKKNRTFSLPFFATSSGIGDMIIYPKRKQLFNRILCIKPSWKNQIQFHSLQDQNNPPLGILMHRKEAQTVSQTFIRIQKSRAQIYYKDLLNHKKYQYIFTIRNSV